MMRLTYDSPTTIKPICPTRWLCRIVIDLSSWPAGSSGSSKVFRIGVTILGLKLALKIFGPLEELNRCLRSPSATVSGC